MSRWFRWYEGTTEDGKFRVVARKSRVTVRDVIALWAFMLEDAADVRHRGVCTRDEDFMASILDFEDGVVEVILSAMESVGLISVGIGAITICNFKARQFDGDGDPTAAERQRRKRERDSAGRHGHVTRDSRPPDTDTDNTTCEANASPVVARADAQPRPEKPSKPAKGTRWPSDRLPDLAVALPMGFTEPQARKAAETFRDFWCAKPGKDGVKLDWDATWRNWLRRDAERLGIAPLATSAVTATGPPQAPPGAPSHEELRRKYGKPDGPPQRHSEDLLRDRLSVHSGRGDNRPLAGNSDPPGDRGMVSLGAILQGNRLGAGGDEDVSARTDSERNDARDVA